MKCDNEICLECEVEREELLETAVKLAHNTRVFGHAMVEFGAEAQKLGEVFTTFTEQQS